MSKELTLEARITLPSTVDELVDYIDARFPDECIQIGESYEEALRKAGTRDVVQHLRMLQTYDEE